MADGIARRRPGEVVALRYITTRDGSVGATWPARVVEDREDLLALYITGGTVFKEWQPSPGAPDRRLADTPWRNDVLRLMTPGRGYSIWASWWSGEERAFRGWYVNFEEPFRRTSIGFDTNDHTLDIVVSPELSWSWKDEEDFAERVRQGIYSPAFADAVRAEASQVIAAIESHSPPFSDGWDRWAPDHSWTVPSLPPGWDTVPPVQWERRRWAYPASR